MISSRQLFLLSCCFCLYSSSPVVTAWTTTLQTNNRRTTTRGTVSCTTAAVSNHHPSERVCKDVNNDSQQQPKRRDFLHHVLIVTTAAVVSSQPMAAHAVVMDNSNPQVRVFTPGEALGIEPSKTRFQQARVSLNELITNYDEIRNNGGGDNIRRYLGTVGTTSPLYGIPKVLKELQESAEDMVEYTESMNDFDAALRAADMNAYSANFAEFSSAKTKPEFYFQDALKATKEMKVQLDIMAQQLGL